MHVQTIIPKQRKHLEAGKLGYRRIVSKQMRSVAPEASPKQLLVASATCKIEVENERSYDMLSYGVMIREMYLG